MSGQSRFTSRNVRTGARWLVLLLAAAVVSFARTPAPAPQIEIIPGSAGHGAELFREKGCVECHAFNGSGGMIAPDLAQMYSRVRTPYELASALWNHAPRMWRAQRARLLRPTLNSTETADLFAYFYSLTYVLTPGDPANGATLFERACAGCHEVNMSNAGRRPAGPPVSAWTQVGDPLAWAGQMWNHSGEISNHFQQTGAAWPALSTQQMADLLAYLRSLQGARSGSVVFQPGDPELGRITFERTCEACHSFGSRTAQSKIDLLKRPGQEVLMGYIAAMWNHAPIMNSRAGAAFPVLGPGDMNDLVAYLFAQRYFEHQGDSQRGAQLFQTKGCASCHEQRAKETGAPDLTLSTERYSPITMSAAVWRHGPAMQEALNRNQMKWPELNASEMADIAAYLNSRLVPRVAEPSASPHPGGRD